MSDPLRTNVSPDTPQADAERDAKIEALLLTGLDHYFLSDYAQAIDVWTRALFLDRSHARARAYIERARSALAEQQRESEELLHSGVAAFERGEIDAARQLLTAAVQRGGAHEVALAFLTRIDRINAAAPVAATAVTAPARPPMLPMAVPVRHLGARLLKGLFAVVVVAVGAYALASWDQVRGLIPPLSSTANLNLPPATSAPKPLIVPRGSDIAIERARTLFASGHLHDALRALELVLPTSPLRSDADKLKEAIQRELIAHETTPVAQ